jgi:ABC-type lipoprotein release transport system permease subunit
MLILKSLLRRKVRSFLSLTGIAIGVAAIVAFNAISQGFKGALDQYFNESGAQLLVVNKTVQDPAFSRVKKAEYEFVQAQRGVTHVSLTTFSLASPRGLKATSSGMPFMPVFGRTPGDRMLEKFKGRVMGRVLERDNEIMLGSITAENLKLSPSDTMEFFNRTFTVVGSLRCRPIHGRQTDEPSSTALSFAVQGFVPWRTVT